MSYGNLEGDWFVWFYPGPQNCTAFSPNFSRRFAQFTDGLSNSMVYAESQISHYQLRKCSSNGGMTPYSFPDTSQSPAFIQSMATLCSRDCGCPPEMGQRQGIFQRHDHGADPEHQSSATRRPDNPYDLVTHDENQGGATFAALTADSYHPGGVNALMADGSVRFVKDSVNGQAWRALGTIAGGEVISADSY